MWLLYCLPTNIIIICNQYSIYNLKRVTSFLYYIQNLCISSFNSKGIPATFYNSMNSQAYVLTSVPDMIRPIRTNRNWADTRWNFWNESPVENIHIKDSAPFHSELGRKIKNHVEGNAYMKIFCGVSIPFFAALYSTTITCWPQHNVILYPEYWYEPLGPSIISSVMIATPAQLIGCSLVMNINFLLTIKNFLIMFLSDTCAFVTSYILVHIVWVYGAGYPHPMPFIGQFCWSIGAIIRTVSFWFLFPRNLRVDDKNFRRRIIAYFCFTPLNMFIAVGYSQLPSLFFIVPLKWQWCVGLLIPIFKKLSLFVNSKLAFKASGCDKMSARIVLICFVGSLHGLSDPSCYQTSLPSRPML